MTSIAPATPSFASSKPSSPARSPSWPTCRGRSCAWGTFAAGAADLEEGDAFRFDLEDAPGTPASRAPAPPRDFRRPRTCSELLVNDGKIRLRVEDCGADYRQLHRYRGRHDFRPQGRDVPDVVLPVAALSDKDRKDLEFACEMGVDWLALSFVQRPEDVTEARDLAKGRAAILSKIEKPSAVRSFDDILAVSDGVMVARGDLGVELPVQAVPPIQEQLIRKCRAAAKPVIVATQMLESMIESPMPTRAEVSDVATAIYEGADAVMLSAESAAGNYPVEAVETMNNVAISVEKDPTYRDIIEASRNADRQTVADGSWPPRARSPRPPISRRSAPIPSRERPLR